MDIQQKNFINYQKEKTEKSNLRRKSKEMRTDASNAAIVSSKPKRGLARFARRKRWERVCGRILMCRVFLSPSLKIASIDHERVSRFTVSVSKLLIFPWEESDLLPIRIIYVCRKLFTALDLCLELCTFVWWSWQVIYLWSVGKFIVFSPHPPKKGK